MRELRTTLLLLLSFTLVSACSDADPIGVDDDPNGETSHAWAELGGLDRAGNVLTAFEGELIAGASFAGPGDPGGVVRWTGTGWEPMGPFEYPVGASGTASVLDLATLDGEVLAALAFSGGESTVGGVARWTGEDWALLGDSFDRPVSALAVRGGALFAGGLGIHRWDGAAWAPVEGAPDHGRVLALVEYEGDLVAGGDFFEAGGVEVANVVRWDGSTWAPLGGGLNRNVLTFFVHAGNLVAGGSFGPCGPQRGEPATRVALWNGDSWESLGNGLDHTVHTLGEFDGALVAGGSFTALGVPDSCEEGDQEVLRVARWDGSGWAPIGEGLGENQGRNGEEVRAVAWEGALVAIGSFARSGEEEVENVARWER